VRSRAVGEVERPAADAGALAEQDAFRASGGDVHVRGDRVRAVRDPGPDRGRNGLSTGPERVARAWLCDLRALGE
jgi:hypothetical protein